MAGQEYFAFEPPPKPKEAKRPAPKRSYERFRYGRTSLGATIPLLLDSAGKPFVCPCGKVRLMRDVNGGIIVYDTQAPLGCASIHKIEGPLSHVMVARVCKRFQERGCGVHEQGIRAVSG